MKNHLITLIMCLAGAGVASAQTGYLKGGAQLATFAGSQRADNGQFLSYLAGVGIETPFAGLDQTSMNAELHFSLLGFRSELNANSEIRLNYINLPLMVQQQFGTTGLYAGTGIGYGLLIRATAVGGGFKSRINEAYKTSDIYLPVSVGYYLNDGWSIDLRYHLGLSDISVSDDNKSYNRSIQLSIHYFL